MIRFADGRSDMIRRAVVVAVVLFVVSVSIVGGFGTATSGVDQQSRPADNETAAGERLAGTIAVEDTAVSGAVERARFRRALRTADTETARAEVIATYLNRSRDHLDRLETREDALDESLKNGSMTAGEHEARTARLGAHGDALGELTAALATASENLSAERREEYGIEPVTIRQVRDRADALTERTLDERYRTDTAVFGDIARMTDAYNAHVDGDSGILRNRIQGERVNLHVESSNGPDAVVSFRIDSDGRFTEVRAGPRGDATLQAVTDGRTVQRIGTAGDAADAFYRAVDENEIRLEGVGIVGGLEWRLIELADSLRGRT